ncbi:GNAT family N-acetyltransferase [Fictibacillus sp. b24]|uniref:GNAT family N-acetyltransferase n=1 Tax=Fictibacillus sp. b24 TaxID=3055863 RepID=UPI00259FE4A6|nr:GNAT family N-acetyltransferase [Fictibacillus sp. b24]MDM5315542.1 GNAT family N-acetyltransferase [Fictibacillus sp. b24]
MKHIKTYNCVALKTSHGTITVEGPVSAETLESLTFHEDLKAFRPAHEQKKAVTEIAGLDEGRIIIARNKDTVIGYVTYVYPDPLERWSEGNMERLLELGAIEVIPDYRNFKVGKTLLKVSMMDDAMEDYIIITTEYYWHWDLKGTKLSVWDYRKVMEKMMNAGGLEYMATDDPEISSHPANCLMVRIGKRIDLDTVQQFDRLRFKNRFMY